MAKLTPKQHKFVSEYLIDLNATQAAIRAGYSKKTSYSMGQRMLKKVEIQNAIQAATKKRENRTEITQDTVVKELASIAAMKADDSPTSSLKYSNKIRALELLGKHLGMFADRVMVAGVDPDVLQQVEKVVLGNDDKG